MPKRVIIHIGFHKTGTSALQAALAENVELLKQNGIAYPYPDPPNLVAAGACSGNVIQILYNEGHVKSGIPPKVAELGLAFYSSLRKVVDEQAEDTVLISGEFLGHPSIAQAEAMKEAFEGLQVEFYCFVRDPFDYCFSAWRQVVKSGHAKRFSGYFSDPEKRMSMRDGFMVYAEVFGKQLTVLRYERHRKDIAGAFVRAAGLNVDLAPTTSSLERTHNPSLTPSEAALSAAMSRAYKSKNVGRYVARALIQREGRKEFPYYNRAEHQKIIEIFGPSVARINEFLPEADRIAMTLRETGDTPTPILESDAEFVASLLRLGSRKVTFWEAVKTRIRHPRLPSDFNPDVYLLLNPDIKNADLGAGAHYVKKGRREARPYKVF